MRLLIFASPPRSPRPPATSLLLPHKNKAESLAEECCKTMAVIGAKLRLQFPLPVSRSSISSSSSLLINDGGPRGDGGGGGGGAKGSGSGADWPDDVDTRQKESLPSTRRRHVLVAAAVRRLAESCAPGRSGSGGGDSGDGKRDFPGLSLTATALLAGKSGPRHSGKSLPALAGACAALYAHLLEWLALVAEEDVVESEGAKLGPISSAVAGSGSSAGTGDARRDVEGAGVCDGRTFLVDFARRVLLDLLFLFEKKVFAARTATERSTEGRRGRGGGEQEEALLRDPAAELLCAVMDTLDGDSGGEFPPIRDRSQSSSALCRGAF